MLGTLRAGQVVHQRVPVALPEHPQSKAFLEIAAKVAAEAEKKAAQALATIH